MALFEQLPAAHESAPPAPRRGTRLAHPKIVATLTILVVIAVWAIVTHAGLVSTLFLPPPDQLVRSFWVLLHQGYLDVPLWQHVATSLARVLVALFFAVIIAVPLGILMGSCGVIRAAIDPLVEFYRPVPPLAYLPLIVIWCGIGELSKVLLIFLALFAPLLISTVGGVLRVDRSRVQAARSLGASRWQVICYVVLPSALPEMITGLRIALGVGWSTLVAAELVAADTGLGFMVQSAAQYLATDVVMVGIIIIAIIALLMEFGLRWVQRRFTDW
ncbi:ABC transporter permease subunit [Carnimonas bestiolae]|uniref:ABC transporter permease subunit n=1 Tax=Carnimonas bestiolae TaxID=3402172 RepID=UPI003EDBA32E